MCPICQADVPASPRYPDALCAACAGAATDLEGRPVQFYNVDMTGGVMVHFPDDGTCREFGTFDCLVRGVRCRVEENRFGGVVLRPV